MNKKKLITLAGFGLWAGRKAYKKQKRKKERENVYSVEVRTPTKKALKEDVQKQKKELTKKAEKKGNRLFGQATNKAKGVLSSL